jgi:carbonic anhydrase/acetyltransferase-like protein (isoleucine patch superfamily)
MTLQSIHPSVFIAPGVQLYGRVSVGEGSSLWPYVVIRSECQRVQIGEHTNVQDFTMIHVGYEAPTRIGDRCSITHRCVIHGATIEDDCLIGIGAIVMDGAVVGRGSIVAPGAVVREGMVVPPHSLVAGVPGKVIKQRDFSAENRENAWNYSRNAQAYAKGEHRAWEGEAFAHFRAEMRARGEARRG